MDDRLYPQGTTPHYSRYVNGILKFFKRSDHSEIFAIDGVNGVIYEPGKALSADVTVAIADVNAGADLIAAVVGHKIQLVSAALISVGGAIGTATSVEVEGSGGDLLSVAAAGLTEDALVREDHANATLLAAGASYDEQDENTAITISATGTADTATHVRAILTYTLVRA